MSLFSRIKASFSSSSSTPSSPSKTTHPQQETSSSHLSTLASTRPSAPDKRRSLSSRGLLTNSNSTKLPSSSSPLPSPPRPASALAVLLPPPRVELLIDGEDAAQLCGSYGRKRKAVELTEEERRTLELGVLEEVWMSCEEVAELVELVGATLRDRGLSTPNLFLLHQSPSSLDTQQTLLIHYLKSKRPSLFPPTSSPSESSLFLALPSPTETFLTELKYTPGQHDLVAVILFALRHLEASSARLTFYERFATLEREGEWNMRAWGEFQTQSETDSEAKRLFAGLLELLMGAAAHEAKTGIGADQLTGMLGFWLFRTDREMPLKLDGLVGEAEEYGRKLQHLLLAYIRDQSTQYQIPTRLLPLIADYISRPSSLATHSSSPDPTPSFPISLISRPRTVLHIKIRFPPTMPEPLRSSSTRMDPVFLAEHAFQSLPILALLDRQLRNRFFPFIEEEDQKQERVEGKVDLSEIFSAETMRLIGIVQETYPYRLPVMERKDERKPKKKQQELASVVPLAEKKEPTMYRPFRTPSTLGPGYNTPPSSVISSRSPSSSDQRPRTPSDIKSLNHILVDSITSSSIVPCSCSKTVVDQPSRDQPQQPFFSEFGMLLTPPSSAYASPATAISNGNPSESFPSPPSSTWDAFSSFGFGEPTSCSTSTPSFLDSPPLSLQLNDSLTIPSSSAGPKRISARSAEMNRILGVSSHRDSITSFNDNAPSSSTPPGAPHATPTERQTLLSRTSSSTNNKSPPRRPPPAETPASPHVTEISVRQLDEPFFQFTQNVLADPIVTRSFPTFALYELQPSAMSALPITSSGFHRAVSNGPLLPPASSSALPEWLLISVVPPASLVSAPAGVVPLSAPSLPSPAKAPVTTIPIRSIVRPRPTQRPTALAELSTATSQKRKNRLSSLFSFPQTITRRKSLSSTSALSDFSGINDKASSPYNKTGSITPSNHSQLEEASAASPAAETRSHLESSFRSRHASSNSLSAASCLPVPISPSLTKRSSLRASPSRSTSTAAGRTTFPSPLPSFPSPLPSFSPPRVFLPSTSRSLLDDDSLPIVSISFDDLTPTLSDSTSPPPILPALSPFELGPPISLDLNPTAVETETGLSEAPNLVAPTPAESRFQTLRLDADGNVLEKKAGGARPKSVGVFDLERLSMAGRDGHELGVLGNGRTGDSAEPDLARSEAGDDLEDRSGEKNADLPPISPNYYARFPLPPSPYSSTFSSSYSHPLSKYTDKSSTKSSIVLP